MVTLVDRDGAVIPTVHTLVQRATPVQATPERRELAVAATPARVEVLGRLAHLTVVARRRRAARAARAAAVALILASSLPPTQCSPVARMSLYT